MSKFSPPVPPSRPRRRAASAETPTLGQALGTVLGVLVLAPLVLTLLWNYGGTEVIEALGGPDANLNVLDGWLAVMCFTALTTVGRRGLVADALS